MRKGCNHVLPSDGRWSCLIFVYVQRSNYLLLVNFECFSLKKLTAMHEIENPLTYALRDELKFPKVSCGLLCGMEEDHFCFYESPQIQAAIFIVNVLQILKE